MPQPHDSAQAGNAKTRTALTSAARLLLAILVLLVVVPALFNGPRFFGVVDVNGDGLIDVNDAIQIIDQNGDGQISRYELASRLLALVGAVAAAAVTGYYAGYYM